MSIFQDPFDRKVEDLKWYTKRGTVVGLEGVTGVLPRIEIDLMIANEPEMFNLMTIAFKRIQEKPESDITSYFNIASIHGYPKRPWNNIEGKILGVGGETFDERYRNESGYCAHSLTTFPTWHRIYLVMLEQVLFCEMYDIAQEYYFPQKRYYLEAVKRWRLPYWDYFRPRRVGATFPGIIDKGESTSAPYDFSLPEIFTTERVQVKEPPFDFEVELKENPYHHFSFNDKVGNLTKHEWDFLSIKIDEEMEPLLHRARTHRHPRRTAKGTVYDNPDRMSAIMNELRMDSTRYMLDMIGQDYYSDYDSFSNMSTLNKDPTLKPEKVSKFDKAFAEFEENIGKGDGRVGNLRDKHFNAATTAWENSGSLEDFHNLFHLLLGGLDPGAHVSRVPIAAFDPAFWFHHNNIERIFTIWQVSHSGLWNLQALDANPLDKDKAKGSWFSKKEDANKEMLPFKQKDGTFWTADEVKNTEKLGYTYPDLVGKTAHWEMRYDFDKLYRWSVPKRSTESWLPCPESMKPLDLSRAEIFVERPDPPTIPPCRNVATVDPSESSEDCWDWFITARVERLALNGAFSILYYINDEAHQDFDDKKDIMGPTLAGISYIFAAPVETCPNCKRQMEEGVQTESKVPITSQLLDYIAVGQLESLKPEHVRGFLVKHLRWRIVGANGTRVDPRVMSTKKQFRLGVSATQNHGGPINNENAPDIWDLGSIIKEIIANAGKGDEKEALKLAQAKSANNPAWTSNSLQWHQPGDMSYEF